MKQKKFIKKSIYPGGQSALMDFIKKHLKYPQQAIINQIEGNVVAVYKVNSQGIVFDIKIKKGIGYGCDAEAERIIRKLKYPKAINRKIRVTTSKKITIKFKLPKPRKTIINYTIVK